MRDVPIGIPTVCKLAGIEVTLTRKRVKNINFRVKPDGEVRVSAPPQVSLPSLEQAVRERLPWIERARVQAAQKAKAGDSMLGDGDILPLWGKPLTIRHVVYPPAVGVARCQGHKKEDADVLVMELDERIAGTDDEARAVRQELVDALYKNEMQIAAPLTLVNAERVVGKRARSLRYRKMKTRWGSCNVQTANITLNTNLAAYSPRCLSYVLVHELCHLHEASHNARFHDLMDGFCPDWRALKSHLAAGPLSKLDIP